MIKFIQKGTIIGLLYCVFILLAFLSQYSILSFLLFYGTLFVKMQWIQTGNFQEIKKYCFFMMFVGFLFFFSLYFLSKNSLWNGFKILLKIALDLPLFFHELLLFMGGFFYKRSKKKNITFLDFIFFFMIAETIVSLLNLLIIKNLWNGFLISQPYTCNNLFKTLNNLLFYYSDHMVSFLNLSSLLIFIFFKINLYNIILNPKSMDVMEQLTDLSKPQLKKFITLSVLCSTLIVNNYIFQNLFLFMINLKIIIIFGLYISEIGWMFLFQNINQIQYIGFLCVLQMLNIFFNYKYIDLMHFIIGFSFYMGYLFQKLYNIFPSDNLPNS